MARNGNKNTGKKYVKLRGGETPTREAEARAQDFLQWYGANCEYIRERLIYAHLYDDALATDTMLNMYDGIALKGHDIRDYKFYFLRAYHTNFIAKRRGADWVDLDFDVEDTSADVEDSAIDQILVEVLDYVRDNFSPAECSLFEIYVGLLPDISYSKLAKMLGLSLSQVWQVIGAIRKDLKTHYKARYVYLRTRV